MRTGIVVNSSADLPASFVEKHDVKVMPITINMNGMEFKDQRNPKTTLNFYRNYSKTSGLIGHSVPSSVDEISQWFLDELVLEYDRVLVLTTAGSRSPTFENAKQASYSILTGYRDMRRKANLKGSFSLRVVDTENLFTGEALLAHDAVRALREENLPIDKLRRHVEELRKHTYTFAVPKDIYYLRESAKRRGHKTVGPLKYAFARSMDIKPILCAHQNETYALDHGRGFDNSMEKLFAHTRAEIEKGLRIPLVLMSYAGDPLMFEQRKDYLEFLRFCSQRNIQTELTMMSSSAGIFIGPGAFSLSFATR